VISPKQLRNRLQGIAFLPTIPHQGFVGFSLVNPGLVFHQQLSSSSL
jgi:hypothetical protein